MPTYDYRCTFCGPFTRLLSIRDVTATSSCPDCGESAVRVFTSPVLIGGATPVHGARAAAEASADVPQVVRRQDRSGDREPARLPGRLAGLPRP